MSECLCENEQSSKKLDMLKIFSLCVCVCVCVIYVQLNGEITAQTIEDSG